MKCVNRGRSALAVTWENEPAPTSLELVWIEISSRAERAVLTLGIRARSRAILRVMLSGDRCWSVQAIADRTGQPRTTARDALLRLAGQGNVVQKGRKYCLTDFGRGLLLRLERETFQIAVGGRAGYSPELIRHFRDLPTANPTGDAATVSFPTLHHLKSML